MNFTLVLGNHWRLLALVVNKSKEKRNGVGESGWRDGEGHKEFVV